MKIRKNNNYNYQFVTINSLNPNNYKYNFLKISEKRFDEIKNKLIKYVDNYNYKKDGYILVFLNNSQGWFKNNLKSDDFLNSIDTLINAINSQIVSLSTSYSLKSSSNLYFIIVFLVAVFILSSQGYNVLYVFLIADLICCCLVLPFLLGLFGFNITTKQIYIISFLSLLLGVLIFPDPSYSKNILSDFLNINFTFINNYKLFSSFLVPILFSTILTLLMKKKGI